MLISAPAGFGKSTLVAEWRVAPAETRSFVWVSLDQAHNEPFSLWAAIVAALDKALTKLDNEQLIRILMDPNPDIDDRLLPHLLNALAARHEPVILVLDNFHVLDDPACHRQVETFVNHLPPAVQLVLTTRADPMLPLPQYRGSGDIMELREADLRFGHEEAALLVRGVAGIRLRDADVDDLIERTEGWPLAIYLAALSLRESTDPAAFIHDFDGTNPLVRDYLHQEVLRPLPADLRRFLRRTSILNRLTAPLCEVVTEAPNAPELLARTERFNVFLTPLDSDRTWFRYHRLFRAAMYSELTRTEPDIVPMMHRRASGWFAGNEMVHEAIGHALAGADFEHAMLLFTRHWADYIDAGLLTTMREWIADIGAARVGTEPVSTICAAWIMGLSGYRRAMRRWLEVAETLPQAGPLPDGIASVRFMTVLARAFFGFDGLPSMLRAAKAAVALGAESPTRWYPLARVALGYGRYLTGDLEAAIQPLEEVRRDRTAMPTFRVLALSILSLTMADLGRAAPAAVDARAAYELAERTGLAESPTTTLAATALGATLTREGRYHEARRMLEHTLAIRGAIEGLSPWPTVNSLIALAHLSLATGDTSAARAFLTEAHDLVAAEPDDTAHLRSVLAKIKNRLADTAPNGLPAQPLTRREGRLAEPLTKREQAVLRLLRGDLSLREIGRELYVSANTVKTHTRSIYRKLGVSSREQAISRAREIGLL